MFHLHHSNRNATNKNLLCSEIFGSSNFLKNGSLDLNLTICNLVSLKAKTHVTFNQFSNKKFLELREYGFTRTSQHQVYYDL